MRLAIALLATLSFPLAAEEFPGWMAGTWRVDSGGTTVEEHWTDAAGGLMLGTNRTIGAGGRASFEFLRIAKHEGRLAYIAMPGGQPATVFPLKSLEGTRVVFENRAHDFPQRIIYWRDGERLCGRVEGREAAGDDSLQWCWERIPAE